MSKKKCDPVLMRKTLELVDSLKKAQIEFIPMPVIDDRPFLEKMLIARMGIIDSKKDGEG